MSDRENRGDIGVVGLGVMGANLALNLADSGHRVIVYNRTTAVTEEFVAGEAGPKDIVGVATFEELVDALGTPRVILLLVQAGPPVDAVLNQLVPLLRPGDVVIDGGNSLYTDSNRRHRDLAEHGIRFLGVGISGGEEGARHGPSLMLGGDEEAWPVVDDMLKSIAAVAPDGVPCCNWVGPEGAGHFVKMVHNGIEYGDMQVIAEAYDLMRRGMGMSPPEIGDVFAQWNDGRLQSYLVEITADILHATENGNPLIDSILDAAGQKGTGKWTVVASMDLAEPIALVAEAVYARIVSSDPERRQVLSEVYDSPVAGLEGVTLDDIETALYASKIISYTQGFRLMGAASAEYGWSIDPGGVAALWRAGCIIRAVFLEDITAAYRAQPDLNDLSLAPFFVEALRSAEAPWRRVVAAAVGSGIPAPAYSSALAYFDGMRSARLPANLIQAQRDYFGAHTFERTDSSRGTWFHHDWAGSQQS